MHKYMNKELNLCAVIMHSKPGYKAGKRIKSLTIFLNENFTVNCKTKYGVQTSHICASQNGKIQIQLFNY